MPEVTEAFPAHSATSGTRSDGYMPVECPICGSPFSETSLTQHNVNFLKERARDGTLDAAVTLARVSWNSFPSLRLSADSQVVVSELLKSLQERVNMSLAPMEKMILAVSPLISSLEKLTEKLPENIQNEFEGTDKTLKTGLDELKKTAEGIKGPIQKDITNLNDTINKLIYKPIVKGTVAERSLAAVWQEAFLKDQVKPLGGAGRTDILICREHYGLHL